MDYTKRFFHILNSDIVPQHAKFIFVSDFFSDEFTGGAELTTEALISNKNNVYKLKSNRVTKEVIERNMDRKWVLGNISQINEQLIPDLMKLNYVVLEFDYKFCKYRSIEKHYETEKKECDCVNTQHGKKISNLLSNAKHVFYMSEEQKNRQLKYLKNLNINNISVLSSVFTQEDLNLIKNLFLKNREKKNDKYVVFKSNSWIKGTGNALHYVKEKQLEYELIGDLRYHEFLEKLSFSKGIVYLPNGGDTCPRMIIEAKLLGCTMVVNDNVQHIKEKWFDTNDLNVIYDYLEHNSEHFWKTLEGKKVVISGYTQTRNCIEQNYPWKESIRSLLGFCDEVVVVDGGSTDNTWNELQTMSLLHPNLKVFQHQFNWNDKRFALYDGQLKAISRSKCTGDVLWQSDIDEIVHEDDFEKIIHLANQLPNDVDVITLPLIEFWGSKNKIRVDVLPWKWRLSKNSPNITHGVPKSHQRFDEQGLMYSLGSDGTDYIYKDTNEPVIVATFYTQEIEQCRQAAMMGNQEALNVYEKYIHAFMKQFPIVYHYSWFNIERKIYTYKNYWSKHWESLFNKKQEDTIENNMFFHKKWKDVNNDEIKKLSDKLEKEMGGWIFHQKIDFNRKTPWLNFTKKHPRFIQGWIKSS